MTRSPIVLPPGAGRRYDMGGIAATFVASYFLAHPATGKGISGHLEITDPVTVSTTSSTLNRPIRLRYVEGDAGEETRISYVATPVKPGVAGPAGAPGPAVVPPIAADAVLPGDRTGTGDGPTTTA